MFGFVRGCGLVECTCHPAVVPLGLRVSMLKNGPSVSSQQVADVELTHRLFCVCVVVKQQNNCFTLLRMSAKCQLLQVPASSQ